MSTLECSSKDDSRFSALYAKLTIKGKTQSIENWYQLSKCFSGKRPKSFNQAKHIQHLGYSPTSIFIFDKEYDIKYLTAWYELLWVKYLDKNPELVENAKQYDEFTDMFRNKNTINCQADIIRDYVQLGRVSIISRHKEFINLLKGE